MVPEGLSDGRAAVVPEDLSAGRVTVPDGRFAEDVPDGFPDGRLTVWFDFLSC